MNIKQWIRTGFRITKESEKDQVIKKIKSLLESTELKASDLDAIVSSIDGKLWEEEIKKQLKEQSGNKLWTMQELEELYEDEIDALNAKIDQLQIDKDYLEQTNLELNAKAEALSGAVKGVRKSQYDKGILRPCTEEELYDDEIRQVLLDTLSNSLSSYKKGSRRYDVISSVLKANDFDGSLKKKQEAVKAILKDADGSNDRIAAKLKDLGLQLESDGKHAKYSYYGDKRYMATLAKTSSDKRSGLNVASAIIDVML